MGLFLFPTILPVYSAFIHWQIFGRLKPIMLNRTVGPGDPAEDKDFTLKFEPAICNGATLESEIFYRILT